MLALLISTEGVRVTRAELGRLTDTELRVFADGARLSLSRSWERGEAGSLTMIYDLALATSEASVRGLSLTPLRDPAQLGIFD